jgi:hypothetical protein
MFRQFSSCVRQQLEVADEPQPQDADQPVVQQPAVETTPVAGAPLAFRALWAIIVRFFKRLFGRSR